MAMGISAIIKPMPKPIDTIHNSSPERTIKTMAKIPTTIAKIENIQNKIFFIVINPPTKPLLLLK